MIAGRNFENYDPVTWVGRVPVYVSTILVAVQCVAMIVFTMAGAAGQNWGSLFAFSSEAVISQFAVWQIATYALVNQPTIWFLIEMFLLYQFGREVERFLGRRGFIWLYAALWLVTPLLLGAFQLFGHSSVYAGSSGVNFGVFVAFATIYPGAQFFFGITAKWLAVALVAIRALQDLGVSNWTGLTVNLAVAVAAFGMIRQAGIGSSDTILEAIKKPLRKSVPPKTAKAPKKIRVEDPAEMHPDSIDPILEKISRSGLSSLTSDERERLEKVRNALLEKERKS